MRPRFLIVGESSCGKSAYAETMASRLNRPRRYFATLESSEDSRLRIERHRLQRRYGHWCLYEMSGLFKEDLEVLVGWLQGPGTVLIDGFSIALSRWRGSAEGTWRDFPTVLKILAYAECSWIIVDHVPSTEEAKKDIYGGHQSKKYLKDISEIDGVMSCVFL